MSGLAHGDAGRVRTVLHESVVHKGFGRNDTDFGATRTAGGHAINARIDAATRLYRPAPARGPIAP